MRASIATVIVTFNRKALLIECLEANLAQTRPADRIIVVDNASTDGTSERLADHGFLEDDRIEYLRLDENIGGAGGFARGMARAMEGSFDWIWLMDDDASPKLDALEELLKGLAGLPAETPDMPCVLTSCVTTKTGEIDTQHRRIFNFTMLDSKRVKAEAYNRSISKIDVGTFVGFMVNRATVDRVGLPCADYFIYFDDIEYSLRIKQAGGNIYLVPRSRIVHPEDPNDSKSFSRSPSYPWRSFYQTRNQISTYRRYAPNGLVLFYLVLRVLMLRFASIVVFQPDKWHRSKMFFRAVLDGYRGRLGKTIDPAAG